MLTSEVVKTAFQHGQTLDDCVNEFYKAYALGANPDSVTFEIMLNSAIRDFTGSKRQKGPPDANAPTLRKGIDQVGECMVEAAVAIDHRFFRAAFGALLTAGDREGAQLLGLKWAHKEAWWKDALLDECAKMGDGTVAVQVFKSFPQLRADSTQRSVLEMHEAAYAKTLWACQSFKTMRPGNLFALSNLFKYVVKSNTGKTAKGFRAPWAEEVDDTGLSVLQSRTALQLATTILSVVEQCRRIVWMRTEAYMVTELLLTTMLAPAITTVHNSSGDQRPGVEWIQGKTRSLFSDSILHLLNFGDLDLALHHIHSVPREFVPMSAVQRAFYLLAADCRSQELKALMQLVMEMRRGISAPILDAAYQIALSDNDEELKAMVIEQRKRKQEHQVMKQEQESMPGTGSASDANADDEDKAKLDTAV